MISFKSFVSAIHDAIMNSSDSLMDRNKELFEKYFEESITGNSSPDSTGNETKKALSPKTVTLDFPRLTSEGTVETTHIQVPLITLVPISASQIEKATLTADFEMEVVDDVLQLHLSNADSNKVRFFKKPKSNHGRLEIVITPKETTEGLKQIIEGYEAILKRQIS